MTDFAEELRDYLLTLDGRARAIAELEGHDRHWAHYLRRLGERALTREAAEKELAETSRAHVDDFVRESSAALARSVAHGASEAELRDWVDRAIDRAMRVPVSGLDAVQEVFLDQAAASWEWRRISARTPAKPDVARYALELRLVRQRAVDERSRTAIGEAWLATPGTDAIRLLLALEIEQAKGPYDRFRLAESGAVWLAKQGKGAWLDADPDGAGWELSWPTFERLRDLGLIELKEDDAYPEVIHLDVDALGRVVLSETAREGDPFRLIARALIDDERGVSIESLVPAFEQARRDHAGEVSARETRLVAHEIRNALVPVRLQLDRLYGALGRSTPTFDLDAYRAPIDRGLTRLFEFVDARLKMAHAIHEASMFFIDDAVGEASLDVLGGTATTLVHDLRARGVRVRGPRSELIGVITELVRNARLAQPMRAIEVHVGTRRDGDRVVIEVDDDGGGVPSDAVPRLFERGFSARGGSGQGLALAKEIVEAAFGGSIAYDASSRGGARFSLSLPIAKQADNR